MKEEGKSQFCNCLYFSTNALARTLSRMADDAFAKTGLSPSYAFVLMAVNGKPGISPSELAIEMQMQPSTITRFIDKLEQKKYVKREFEGKTAKILPLEKSVEIDSLLHESWSGLYDEYKEILGPNMAKMLSNNIVEANERLT